MSVSPSLIASTPSTASTGNAPPVAHDGGTTRQRLLPSGPRPVRAPSAETRIRSRAVASPAGTGVQPTRHRDVPGARRATARRLRERAPAVQVHGHLPRLATRNLTGAQLQRGSYRRDDVEAALRSVHRSRAGCGCSIRALTTRPPPLAADEHHVPAHGCRRLRSRRPTEPAQPPVRCRVEGHDERRQLGARVPRCTRWSVAAGASSSPHEPSMDRHRPRRARRPYPWASSAIRSRPGRVQHDHCAADGR